MRWYPYLASLALVVLLIQSSMAGDINRGKQKSKQCVACHGTDGNSASPSWPKLAGQGKAYLITQLQYFKSGKRKNVQMSPMASNLTDEDIKDIAAFFSSQQIVPGETQAENIGVGERVYRFGNSQNRIPACMACHGPSGKGIPEAQYPALGGQHAAYIEAQLNAFRNGKRVNKVMHTIASRMSDEEIKAVSDYVQGLY